MQNLYGQHYAGLDSQGNGGGYAQDVNMEALDNSMLQQSSGQTIDQIINQNNQEMMRRRQTYHPNLPQDAQRDHMRRSSMLEFSSNGNGELADFQFDPNPQQSNLANHVANMNMMYQQKGLDPRRVRSRDDLTIDTRFSGLPNYDGSMSAYPASMIPNTAMSMDTSPAYLAQNLDFGTDYDAISQNLVQANMSANQHLHQQSQQQQQHPPQQQSMFTTSPMAANFPMDYSAAVHDQGGGTSPGSNHTSRTPQNNPASMSSQHKFMGKSQNQLRRAPMMPSPLSLSAQNSMTGSTSTPLHVPPGSTVAQHTPGNVQAQQPRSRRTSMDMQSPYLPQSNNDMSMENSMPDSMVPQMMKSRLSNAYSATGFDMLAVLMRVATRRNPQINIGPVDLACAFVVCDIQKHDLPIIYCSDMFERLTGYSRHEILGRNCRFLQAPDGKVQSGIKRKYVDDKSVLYLKNQINRRTEAQLSLINYRKGGQPFMNLLTIIPITWDTDEYKYFVGFQVDLVEQPNSVSAKNPDGTYEINYNRSALPAYRLPEPPNPSNAVELSGQTVPREEVSQVLATIGNGETDLSRRIWDKVLLENTDDVVHVLSLKGLFLYLSPACKTILEYEASELVGMALSAVCHPSDIVPVTRELKDSSNGSAVNVVYRIRRKNSGYTWFEAHGSLHTEQGKGRKCIILVGRQRPVYALDRNDITINEGAGDAELWAKISTSGMFLYVSSSSRSMLDRLPDDLVGTSMQALMRPESRMEFGRVLELARLGERSTFKHDMQNRRGQVLQAQTTIYPGDAREGLKPTFLLTQTRLLKMTRAMLLNQKSTGSVPRSDVSMSPGTPLSNAPGNSTPAHLSRQDSLTGAAQTLALSNFRGESGILTQAGSGGVPLGSQDEALASEDNIFDELKTTRSTSWQFELRQMERQNRLLSEELQTLLSRKKKRKRRKGMGNLEKDCANCHTRVTPEWRRGPSGQRDLCNSCGLRWAKLNGRVSPRKSGQSEKSSTSPMHTGNVALSGSNPSGSKESSIETKATPATTTNATSTEDGTKTPTNFRSTGMKQERDDTELGSMPTVIEEGQEPPHSSVLPV